MVEIYNEQVRDLLLTDNTPKQKYPFVNNFGQFIHCMNFLFLFLKKIKNKK